MRFLQQRKQVREHSSSRNQWESTYPQGSPNKKRRCYKAAALMNGLLCGYVCYGFSQIRVALLRTHYNGFYFSRNQNLQSLYIVFQASNLLERMVWEYPQQSLHQDVLFNLNTIYELETSRALQKKHKLLDLVSKHKGDGFFTQCLKLTQTTREKFMQSFCGK